MSESLLVDFIKAVGGSEICLRSSEIKYNPLTNDALFHLPLISVAILVIAKGKKAFSVTESGRLVGLVMENSIAGFKGSSQGLGWSTTLRARTAEAIAAMEAMGFVAVREGRHRPIELTEAGNKFVLSYRKSESPLGEAVRGMFRNLPDAEAETLRLL